MSFHKLSLWCLLQSFEFLQLILAYSCSSLGCVRTADIAILTNVSLNVNSSAFYGTFGWAPVVDGTFITQRPTVSLREGKINGVRIASRSHQGNDYSALVLPVECPAFHHQHQ